MAGIGPGLPSRNVRIHGEFGRVTGLTADSRNSADGLPTGCEVKSHALSSSW